jgi:hypothetical protein
MLLAACSGGGESAKQAAPPFQVEFASGAPDLIEVHVRDQQPVKSAKLVQPDGTFYEAYAIDTERHENAGGGGISPSFGVGVAGGSSSHVSTGVGIGFPIFGSSGSSSTPEYRSTVRIRVTDMTAYRASWQKSELRLTLGEGSSQHDVVIPAPSPPQS